MPRPLRWARRIVALLLALVTIALIAEYVRWRRNAGRASQTNQERLSAARPVDLPRTASLAVTVLVDWEAEPGFQGEPAVSYVIRTDRGVVLYDLGFGASSPTLVANARRLGVRGAMFDAAAISHLHMDHIGGIAAQRERRISLPTELGPAPRLRWLLPDTAETSPRPSVVVSGPRAVDGGLASTGPLARSLFGFGWTEEQALVARLEGKGLVVFTGCGHPTLAVILGMVRRMSSEPIYAVVGGLHLPITSGRPYRGLALQRFIGTGYPPWRLLTDEDLAQAIAALKNSGARRLLVSAHDSCDHAIARLRRDGGVPVDVLRAGRTYSF
jgi:7,8-dihydropterin-6-yl-methyl-4-(beta-D-ribofuranosyl)aminobenzene 5'-phosphate synthase